MERWKQHWWYYEVLDQKQLSTCQFVSFHSPTKERTARDLAKMKTVIWGQSIMSYHNYWLFTMCWVQCWLLRKEQRIRMHFPRCPSRVSNLMMDSSPKMSFKVVTASSSKKKKKKTDERNKQRKVLLSFWVMYFTPGIRASSSWITYMSEENQM